nr:hypothetical protein CFP56_28687 [Quercus suber]
MNDCSYDVAHSSRTERSGAEGSAQRGVHGTAHLAGCDEQRLRCQRDALECDAVLEDRTCWPANSATAYEMGVTGVSSTTRESYRSQKRCGFPVYGQCLAPAVKIPKDDHPGGVIS